MCNVTSAGDFVRRPSVCQRLEFIKERYSEKKKGNALSTKKKCDFQGKRKQELDQEKKKITKI